MQGEEVNTVRQAVVVVHGMGEQLPLTTLARFIDTAIEPGADGERSYYSRPESVTGSFESRRFLAPRLEVDGEEKHAQTDFFEYHWADKMQGNRLDDLWPTFRRMLLRPPWRVPVGLRGIWLVAWAGIAAGVWAFTWGPWRGPLTGDGDLVDRVVAAVVSGGLASVVVTYFVSRLLPGWLTASFVDVVRYLDTSPRSYAVRREIRKGLVELLQRLSYSRAPRYDRIVIVAHSLGAFIGYDAISYMWGLTNAKTNPKSDISIPDGLKELEQAASDLVDAPNPTGEMLASFQDCQARLWRGIRSYGNPWLISDFVSVGTPMYFADQLMYGKGSRSFERRVDRRELPMYPPQSEESSTNNIHGTTRFYSWEKTWRGRRRVLYEGAPFAVVRWTNLYFPTRFGFFGDWFGGPLAPLFGPGIRDVKITGNTLSKPGTLLLRNRSVPAYAHALYFRFPEDNTRDSVASAIRRALDLASTAWISGDEAQGTPAGGVTTGEDGPVAATG